MAYKHPIAIDQEAAARAAIEDAKASVYLNERLTDEIFNCYLRMGFHYSPTGQAIMKEEISRYIRDVVNPLIQDAMIERTLSKADSEFYQLKPTPIQQRPPSYCRYYFFSGDKRKSFSEECNQIVRMVYSGGSSNDFFKVKTVKILNAIQMALDIDINTFKRDEC